MKKELYWLTLITLQTAVMFIPYVLNLFYKRGILGAMNYYEPKNPPLSDWAQKARAAHQNSVENLVVLAPATIAYVLLMGSGERGGESIVQSLQIYFCARMAHYMVYSFKFNFARTVFFLMGWAATINVIFQALKLALGTGV